MSVSKHRFEYRHVEKKKIKNIQKIMYDEKPCFWARVKALTLP